MMQQRSMTWFAVLLGLAAVGPARSDEAGARAIHAHLDPDTIAVVRIDASRLRVEAVADLVARVLQDDRSPTGARLRSWLADFQKAGGKELYLVFSLPDLPHAAPYALAPVAAGTDAAAVRRAVAALPGLPAEKQEQLDGVAFVGSAAAHARLRGRRHPERPEVAAALAGAGSGAVQAFLLPTPDCRRVVEEMMPELPGAGGGSPATVLTRGLRWAAVSVDVTPQLAARMVIQSADAQAAQALATLVKGWLAQLGQVQRAHRLIPNLDQLAALLTPTVNGDRLTLTLDESNQGLSRVLASREAVATLAAGRARCVNNLKRIGLAMHLYHDRHRTFPPSSSRDPQDRPLLSWRVHLLPFLGEEALYQQFRLDEPWDSAHNASLIPKMPAVYRCPAAQLRPAGRTTYLVPTGEETVFPPGRGVALREIADGSSDTALVVDVGAERAVVWTKPDDLVLDPARPLAGLVDQHGAGFVVLLADGSVRFLGETIEAATLKALFTRSGGEVVQIP